MEFKEHMTENLRKEEIFEIVTNILVEILGIDKTKIQPESNIVDDLGADSLDSIEIVMAAEERFKISIPDEDTMSIKTVEALVDYIENKEK